MSEEHARIRHLKQQWDDEDAARDELERQVQRSFLEEQANQLFAPIEDFLTRLDKVLRTVGGSVEIDGIWEHLGDRRLHRIAKVTSAEPRRQLSVDFTIQAARIFYCGTFYQFSYGIEALIAAITREVEQFLKPPQAHLEN
jgi:hypothetical protein